MNTKTQVEPQDKAPPSAVGIKQPETPEKLNGPQRAMPKKSTASAESSPNGAPAPARGAEILSDRHGQGAVSRARTMMTLQRRVGNHRASNLIGQRKEDGGSEKPHEATAAGFSPQPAKLAVGAPDDPFEKEADEVARAVTNSPSDASTDGQKLRRQVTLGCGAHAISRLVQRALDEEREPVDSTVVRATEAKRPVQRRCVKCGRETAQRKCADCARNELQRQSSEAAGEESESSVPAETGRSIAAMRGGGSRLPESVRTDYESRFGYDFSPVRIHTDARAAQTARDLDARAYTLGADIAFGANEYAPETKSGSHLLAHELTHVVQQGASAPLDQAAAVGGGESAATPESSPQRTLAPMRIQRDGPETGPSTSSTAPATSASPNTAAMSASLSGLRFEPPAGTRFMPGSKVFQGLALALRRLIGAQYYPGLENEAAAFLESGAGIEGLGILSGNAEGGEEFTAFNVLLPVAVPLLDWLDEREYSVNISQQQRDLLRYGVFTSMAWADIRSADIVDELGIDLPVWYNENLFRQEMASNIALLRGYIDAVTRYRRSGSHRAEAVDALRRIVEQITFGARLLEAVRADAELAGHAMYRALWPSPEPAEANAPATPSTGAPERTARARAPRPTPAPPDRVPNTSIAALFISFAATQPSIAEGANREHAARLELLDRFLHFMARVGTSLTGDQSVSERRGRANAPPIPAVLASHPALEPPLFDAALDTDHVFSMHLQFADVFEAFLHFAYLWEYARVPDDRLGQVVDVETLPGSTPGWGEVAGARFSRANRYAAADIRRVVDDLGPAGVNALTLVAANSILRYVGTAIRLGLEVLTTPRTEKHVVFPGPGLYVVRCKAVPYSDGDAEIVRVPSVAYLPVLARRTEEMAESRTAADVSRRERQMERVIELQTMLSEPVSHANQQELEEELRSLTIALGPVENILAEQVRLLEERIRSSQVSAAERSAAQRQLTNLRRIIEVRNDRAAGRSMAQASLIPATFVSDEGQVVRLSLEAVPGPSIGSLTQYWVSDLTTPNSSQATGTGANPTAAVLAAIRTILEGIHGYGRGYATVHFAGQLHTLRIEASLGSILVEAVENVATAMSVAAVVAAPFTGGASLALLIPIGVVGAIPSGYRLISRSLDDTLRLDMATVMDIVNIAGSVIGLGGEAAASMRMLRLGRGLMIAGMGADGLGMLLMGAQIMEQIEALQDVEPPGVRAARLMEVIGQAMLQVGIMAGAALYQRGRAHEMAEPHVGPEGQTSQTRRGRTDPELTNVTSQQQVHLGGEAHMVRLGYEDGQLVVKVCSNCAELRQRIDRVLDDPSLAGLPDLSRDLRQLHQRAGRLERDLNSGRLTPEEARRACNEIAARMDELATRHPSELGPMVGVPRGFADQAQLALFGQTIRSHLEGLVGYYEAHIQGSSVTGRNYQTGTPFGAHSDIDLAIVSREMFELAGSSGGDIRGFTRTGPNPPELNEFLGPLRTELTTLMGREVNIVVFESRTAMGSRADSISVPLR